MKASVHYIGLNLPEQIIRQLPSPGWLPTKARTWASHYLGNKACNYETRCGPAIERGCKQQLPNTANVQKRWSAQKVPTRLHKETKFAWRDLLDICLSLRLGCPSCPPHVLWEQVLGWFLCRGVDVSEKISEPPFFVCKTVEACAAPPSSRTRFTLFFSTSSRQI